MKQDRPPLHVSTLDGQHGHDLVGHTGEPVLTLLSEHMRILTLRSCRDVRRLDLRGCPQITWIAIAGCPRLRHLLLPTTEAGVDLHIDFGAAGPLLLVDGSVADFDCCWDRGTAMLPHGTGRRPPVQGVYVGPVSRRAAAGRGGIVVIGDHRPRTTLDLHSLTAARTLSISRCAALETLVLPPRVDAAHLTDLPRLTTLHGVVDRALRVERCPALSRVEGSGHTLTLVDSARTDTLAVGGPWRVVSARDSAPFGVDAPLADCLPHRLHRGSSPTAVAAALTAACDGDDTAREAILAWCKAVRSPGGVLNALTALRDLVRAGVSATMAWEIRTALRARFVDPWRRDRWWWRLPLDLADRGWRADLELWSACCLARPLDAPTLGATGHAVHLATIATTLPDHVGTRSEPILTALFERTLRHRRAPDPGPLWAVEPMMPEDLDHLRRTVQALAALRDHPRAPAFTAAFFHWLDGNLAAAHRTDLFGALHLLGNTRARPRLLALASGPDLDSPGRNRALALALAPPKSAILSFPETADA